MTRIRRLVTCAVVCLATLMYSPASRGGACSTSSNCYGPGLASDSLGNTVVGGQYNISVSYRFRAGHTGSLQKIHLYLIQQRTGYSAGTGGQLLVTINADDGTAAHNPSSTVVASYLLSDPAAATPSIFFPILQFAVPPTLIAGQLYHVVFTNVDPNYSTNYLSVDTLYLNNPPTPTQPTISDLDWAELYKYTGANWAIRNKFTPILELDYSDGWTEGIGYMEVWVGAPEPISGSSAVRETFTVSGAAVAVSNLSIRVARTSGADPLTVRLENGDGSLIEQGQIPATTFPLASPAAYGWGALTFSSAHTLQVGQTYHLVLEAPSSSSYEAFPIRKGIAYNFQNTTFYPDGYAQFYQSGSWVGWTQWGVTNRTDGDLQFYFGVAANDPAPTISNVAAGSLTSGGADVSWDTNQASTSQVEYGPTTSYAYATNVDSTMVTAHSQQLSNLTASTLYHYRVLSTNSSGQQSVSGDLTFTTSAASAGPVISNVTGKPLSTSSAVITWITDEQSTSQVQYGLTTSYGSWSAQDPTLTTSHSQTLSGLSSGTVYHFRVISINAAGDGSVSGDFAFRTHGNVH